LMLRSEVAGYNVGVVEAESALCWAAADGGLADREGLTSLVLFFRDLPGPVVRGAEVIDLRVGRTGDDSLEGIGEFVAEAARLGFSLFVAGIEDVDGSRVDLLEFVAVAAG
jgi:hypothetical protein